MVPWRDVIKAAPEVASTARRLWDSVGKKNPEPDAVKDVDGAVLAPDPMVARLEHAETALADLHAQMLAASEVITTLAQQNAQLVARIDMLRKRALYLAIATGAVSVIAIVIATAAWLARSS
jgi:hypothetical protein